VKIAFIGTHGVGKTRSATIWPRRSNAAASTPTSSRKSRGSRPCPSTARPRSRRRPGSSYQIAEEIPSASQNRVVVCDRSVLDNYAYMVLACGPAAAIERFVDHGCGPTTCCQGADRRAGLARRRSRHRRVLHAGDRRSGGELLVEKEITCQRLPDDRDAWLDVVKDIVLRQPQLVEKLW